MNSSQASSTDLYCLWGGGSSAGPVLPWGALSHTPGAPLSLFCSCHSGAGHLTASGGELSQAKRLDPPVMGISNWSDPHGYRSEDPGDKGSVR